MEKERKVITVRVDSQFKFQIEKCASEEGYSTINSWIIYVLKKYMDNASLKK